MAEVVVDYSVGGPMPHAPAGSSISGSSWRYVVYEECDDDDCECYDEDRGDCDDY